MTNVLLVDDEQLVRAGLRLLLDGAEGITVVGEAADGLAAVQAAAALRPDVVLMDIRMPGVDGIEAAGRLAREHPGLPVLMLTAFDTEAFVADALEAGAHGFLLKTSPPHEIIEAVHVAARGEMAFSPMVLRRIVGLATRQLTTRDEAAWLAQLSERELEVARGVAEGLSNAEIAGRLYLSVATVKTYVNRIFDKTGAQSRVQLALMVERARIAGQLDEG